MLTLHRTLLVASLVGFASVAGCYAEAEPVTVTSGAVVTDDGYDPAYYDGYVVYYDDYGHPFYYNGGAVVWIGPESPHYLGLVNHWRLYGPAYHRWYAHHGYSYRSYRAAPGYHAYHGYHAPAGHRR